jgi:phosphomannomutase
LEERIALFPASGEINKKLAIATEVIRKIEDHYRSQAKTVDYCDGIGLEFNDWRFNLRSSNTEPVLRLNVEARGNRALMEEKTQEILKRIDMWGIPVT